MQIHLVYVGQSSLPGVPARDLTLEEARSFGEEALLASGLYVRSDEKPTTSKPLPRRSDAKMQSGGSENKEE